MNRKNEISTYFSTEHRKERRYAGHQRGSATVEFGLLLPLLLLILMSILEFGLALYDKSVITNAGREGARMGVVLRVPSVTEEEIRKRVFAYAGESLIGLGSTSSLSVDFPVQSNPTQLAVRVNYTFRGIGLGNLLSAMGSPLVLTSITVMSRE